MNTERRTTLAGFKTPAAALLVIAMLILSALQVTPAYAASIVSTATGGDWNAPGTWAGGIVPGPADSVTIANGATVNVTAAASAAALTFAATVDSNTTVNIQPGIALSISGAVTIPRGLTSGVNLLAVGAGTLNAGRISFTTSTGSTGGHAVTISTGTVTVNGNIVGTSGSNTPTISFSDAGLLQVSGTIFTATNGTLITVPGSTVNYDGNGAQNVGNFAYSNLALSGSGAKTLPATATIGGNLTLGGTASSTTSFSKTIGGNLIVGAGTEFDTSSSNTATLTVSGTTTIGGTLTLYNTASKTFTGDVTINSSGIWNEPGVGVITYAGSLQNDGTFTANTGVHNFTGGAAAIGGASPVAIPNLKVIGTLTNNGNLTVSTSLAGAGTLVNGATGVLNFGGSSIVPALDATPAGNTVNYNGAAQAVKATSYDRVALLGSGSKSIAAGTAILGNLSIAPAGSATAGIAAGQTIDVGTLTLGGLDQAYGTWGGTGSPASHINATYFDASTGMLNVGKASLIITAKNLSKTYGDTYTFLGTEFTTSPLAVGDSVSSVSLTSTGAAPSATVTGSPYPILPSAAVGTGLDHYNIKYVSGSMTVTPAPLNVTGITASDKVYDSLTTATLDVSGAALSGLVGTDTATLNTAGASGHFSSPNVGTNLDVQVAGLTISGGQSSNYTLVQPVVHASITPATLTVQAPSKSILASFQGEPIYTPLVTGFKGTDTVAVVTGLTCNDYYDAAGLNPVPDPAHPTDPYPGGPGDFYIICSGASASNYTFAYQSGILHVSSTAAPNLTLPLQLNFGAQQIGTGSLVQTITVQNAGTADLHLYGISSSKPGQYKLMTGGSCSSGGWPSLANPSTVAAGGSCTIVVQFTPLMSGPISGQITIISDNGTSPNSVPLAGSGYTGVQIMLNRSFENDLNLDHIPDSWAKVGTWSSVDGMDCTVHYTASGKCSLKFVANGKVNVAQQTILTSGLGGNGFILSLWSRSVNVPSTATYSVRVLLYNGTSLVNLMTLNFAKGTHSWQVVKGAFSAKAAFNKVVIQITFYSPSGTVWFDIGSLTK